MSFGDLTAPQRETLRSAYDSTKRINIANEMVAETDRQVEKWGQQDWPIYTRLDILDHNEEYGTQVTADNAKALCDFKAEDKSLSWFDICNEEYFEARDEALKGDKAALRMELIQIGACIISAIASLDRNGLEGA